MTLNKRDKLLLSVLAAVAAIGGLYWFVVKPAKADAQAKRDQLSMVQSDNANLQDQLTRLTKQQTGAQDRMIDAFAMSKAVPAHRGRHSHLGGAGVGIGQDVVRTVDEVGVLPLGHEEVDDGHPHRRAMLRLCGHEDVLEPHEARHGGSHVGPVDDRHDGFDVLGGCRLRCHGRPLCLSVHPASPSSTPPTETEDPQVDLRMEHAMKTAR